METSTSNTAVAEERQSHTTVSGFRKSIVILIMLFTLISVVTEIIVDAREWGLDIPLRGVFLSLLETVMMVTTIIIAVAYRRSVAGLIIAALICAYFSYTYIYPLLQ